MKLLVAEDEYTTRLTVQVILEQWGYRVDSVEDGAAAWKILQRADGPQIAILDWEMPGMSGLELCHKVKMLERDTPVYVIMLTGRDAQADILQGFDAGADDYITKPFDENELRARVRVAERLVSIQEELAISNNELRAVLNHVEMLQSSVPVCTSCLKVQRYDERWASVKEYVEEGEDPMDACKREIKEETGLVINALIERCVMQRKPDSVEHVYVGKYDGDPFNIKLDEENQGYGWFSINEIDFLDTVPNLMDYINITLKEYE